MGADVQKVWSECLGIIKDNLEPLQYTEWFEPIKAQSLDGSVLTLSVPSPYYYEQLEEHFLPLLSKVLRRVVGPGVKLQYTVLYDLGRPGVDPYTATYPSAPHHLTGPLPMTFTGQEVNRPVIDPFSLTGISSVQVPASGKGGVQSSQPLNPYLAPGYRQILIDPRLNADYCFDNFVVGECNEFAYKAAQTLVESSGRADTFNPLIIYGSSGLGKTHLAHGIGLAFRERYPEKLVQYVTASEFMTQFTEAYKRKSVNEFVHYYQNMHLLIMDDIHALSTRDGTQQVLFGIFNHLREKRSQMVFTSDRPPIDIKGVRDELLARFTWGLVTEVTTPDYATRLAILKKKCEMRGLHNLPVEWLESIASSVTAHVRELESALNYVMAHTAFLSSELTLHELKKALSGFIATPADREVTLEQIQMEVGRYFGLTVNELNSNTRRREIVFPRQLAMYLASRHTKKTLKQIGECMGGRDHSTVAYAVKTISGQMEVDREVESNVRELERKIQHLRGL